MRKNLVENINVFRSHFIEISDERKEILNQLIDVINNNIKKLVFICTHNSRRSQMSQLWARVAADYYSIDGIETFSGGTEATAFNPRAVSALEKMGISFEKSGEDNPEYTFESKGNKYKYFSKKYDDESNPKDNFCAVMTCSDADENCPYIPGANSRVSLKYDDPKEFDGTELEEEKYLERSMQIATELFYLMSKVKN
jgi:arsenate reductase